MAFTTTVRLDIATTCHLDWATLTVDRAYLRFNGPNFILRRDVVLPFNNPEILRCKSVGQHDANHGTRQDQ